MSELKKRDCDAKNAPSTSTKGDPMDSFNSYDLVAMQIPVDARPRVGGNPQGMHGYTIKSSSGAVPRLTHVLNPRFCS